MSALQAACDELRIHIEQHQAALAALENVMAATGANITLPVPVTVRPKRMPEEVKTKSEPEGRSENGIEMRTLKVLMAAAGLPERFTYADVGKTLGVVNPHGNIARWLAKGFVVRHAGTKDFERTGKWRQVVAAAGGSPPKISPKALEKLKAAPAPTAPSKPAPARTEEREENGAELRAKLAAAKAQLQRAQDAFRQTDAAVWARKVEELEEALDAS